VCRFCSDITSTAGRTYRTRSAAAVVEEVAHQCQRYDARHVVFTDLKLNSDQEVWHGLIDGLSRAARPVRWIGAVHIDGDGRHGLDASTLREAARSGLARLTTGLESGSQRVLDLMKKGTCLTESACVIRRAAACGISGRATVMAGFPGEEAADVAATADFLEAHRDAIERVSLNRFTLMTGSVMDRLIEKQPARFGGIRVLERRDAEAIVEHVNLVAQSGRYRRELGRLLGVVHTINRRPILGQAAEFAGVM
jgi:radical SAM superfamily enzyme YgiQ (UPF0313 family)